VHLSAEEMKMIYGRIGGRSINTDSLRVNSAFKTEGDKKETSALCIVFFPAKL
jgi:hypothetical protein